MNPPPHNPGLDLAPVLGARHDRTATAPSVRSLLVTVLGELVRPSGGSAWTQSLIELLDDFDIEPATVRQAISRLATEGWLTSTRVGRRTRWQITPWAADLLDSGAERIYALGQPRRSWDKRWVLLMASVPESRRDLRYQLGVGLGWAGFGPIGAGTWACPWADRELEAVAIVNELGLHDVTVFHAQVGTTGDSHDLAARGWDLSAVADAYVDFIANTDFQPTDPRSTAVALISLVHAWRRFPLLDPGLPSTLLPADWPGDRASVHFASARARWHQQAADWWSETEALFSAPKSRRTAL